MTVRALGSLGASALPRGKPLKVCIVSLIGAPGNGGIGTASDAMARHIASDGHEVTLLYTLVERGVPVNVAQPGVATEGLRSWSEWRDEMSADGVRLELLDHQGSYAAWLEKSWRVKEFVGSRDFDVVYFDDWQGTGYYALLAKRAGLQPFAGQLHVVFTHASKQWVCVTNDEYLRQVSDVAVLGMERRCVEMADVVLSPSRYLLEEYQRYGWSLPANSFHHPLPLIKAPIAVDGRRRAIDEIVFFGRLETRKGLWLFCDALDRLGDRLAGKTVTFMGPLTATHGTSSGIEILRRSPEWRCKVRLVTDLGSKEALAYIAEGRRLAVMPSLDDNSPCVIYECMQARVPFVTSSSGGGKELIDDRFWPDSVVAPDVEAMTSRLATLLRDGARVVQPSFAPAQALAVWTGWLRLVAQDPAAFRSPPDETGFVRPATRPLLVVIDTGSCPVSVLVANINSMAQRYGARARCLLLSDRRGQALAAVREILQGLAGAETAVFGPGTFDDARAMIAAADIAFFMDADTELLSPFFLMALGTLAQPLPALVTCLGAARATTDEDAPRIEVLPAGDLPGLGAVGQILIGPVWAIAPQRLSHQLGGLSLRDDRHDELFSAWTLGETLARNLDEARLALLPVVGAITPPSDGSRPLQTARSLRGGGPKGGIPASLHQGGAPRFAVETFGARLELPAGALTLRDPTAGMAGPLPQSLALAKAEGDLARMAALAGRADLALQIESANETSATRVEELIGLAVLAIRQRPIIDLWPVMSGARSLEIDDETDDPEESEATHSAFHDPRLVTTDGRIRVTGSTRRGGPAKLWAFDVAVSGHERLELRLRSLSPQPHMLRVRVIDQDCGEVVAETDLRITRRDPVLSDVALPGIFGRLVVVFEFSGADRIDVAVGKVVLS